MNHSELKNFLEQKYLQYNSLSFIENDPILIPHRFSKKEDIEIAGFLIATIAWGQRISIIKNGTELMRLMDDAPADFIKNFNSSDLKTFNKFVHRTFNGDDCIYFLKALQKVIKKHKSLENTFCLNLKKNDTGFEAMNNFRKEFLDAKPNRAEKHISNPLKNSSAKRLSMYLRWMVRKDNCGVDFGIWTKLKPHQLYLPLDVHTGNISRMLKLLNRKQDDWKAVLELTEALKKFDSTDPVKYDFALFGIGVNKDLSF